MRSSRLKMTALSMAGVLLTLSHPTAAGAVPNLPRIPAPSPSATCEVLGPHTRASFVVALVDSVHGPVPEITGIHLSGLPASCSGQTIGLSLWGNHAGDPAAPPGYDTLLSTINSALGACDQRRSNPPQVVVAGGIDLSLCASGGPASFVDLHDVTLLTYSSGGREVPVGASVLPSQGDSGGAHPPPPADTNAAGDRGASGSLAFTGASLEGDAAVGLLVVALGLLVTAAGRWKNRRHGVAAAGRPRRRRPDPSETPGPNSQP